MIRAAIASGADHVGGIARSTAPTSIASGNSGDSWS